MRVGHSKSRSIFTLRRASYSAVSAVLIVIARTAIARSAGSVAESRSA